MTTKDLSQFIGRKGSLFIRTGSGHIGVGVRVIDARITFGSVHVLVTPHRGHGSTWVDAGRVKVFPSQEVTS